MTLFAKHFLALLVLILSIPILSAGQGASLDLTYGSHSVGFSLLQTTDFSRSFPSVDMASYQGRPMRVYLWYPSEAREGPAMKLGDFIQMAADDFRRTGQSRVGLPVPLMKGLEPPQLQALRESPLKAIRDAKRLPGTFPLLVLGQGLYYESPLSEVFLCEYLASRGYIVVTCPLLGTQSRLVNLKAEDLETEVRDMEFALATARSRPDVDPHELGVIGFDLGGMAGLLLCMRNPDVSAFISMSSGILTPHFSGLPGNHPSYQENRFTIPWMHMDRAHFLQEFPKDATSKTLFDRKAFGDSFLVSVPMANHASYSSYALFGIRKQIPGYWGPVEGDQRAIYSEICKLSGVFFDTYLKKDEIAVADLRGAVAPGPGQRLLSIQRKQGTPAPPSSASLINMIIEKGIAEVRPVIEKARATNPDLKIVEERELNWLGYHFALWWGREKEALDIFQLNVELYPGSADVYDSLGEAYLLSGRTEEAIAAYRKSLELDPKNQHAAGVLARLTKK